MYWINIFRFLIFLLLSFSCNDNEQSDFYLSPFGNDSNSGSIDEPLATIPGAFQKIATIDQQKLGDEIKIILRGGRYFIDQTILIYPEHIPEHKKIIFSPYQNEVPIITSGKKVENWYKPANDPKGISKEAVGKLWIANIPNHKEKRVDFQVLFEAHQKLKRSISPGFLPTEPNTNDRNAPKNIIKFLAGSLQNWDYLQETDLVIRPQKPWTMNILPLDKVDEASNIAFTSIDATYPMTRMGWINVDLDETFWIENTLRYLDQPGEWAYHSEEGKLYYWPETDEPHDQIFYPVLQELIRLEGKPDRLIKQVGFQGITFTQTNRDTWTPDDIGLQHDWEMYDKSNALVRLINTENCYFKNCRFIDSGSGGLRMDFQNTQNVVENCEFANLGGTGILISGYGPGELDVSHHNKIVNNSIHHIGESYWHSPAIFIWQSGYNQITNNHIYSCPYTGIVVSGVRPYSFNPDQKRREIQGTIRWEEIPDLSPYSGWEKIEEKWNQVMPFLHARNNVIEYNEIHHVVQAMSDGNAIYLSGCGQDNVVRNNYLHDLYRTGLHSVIRCDDWAKGNTIEKNIIFKFVSDGIKVKHPNKIINNYIIANQTGIFPWGDTLEHDHYLRIVNYGNAPIGAEIKRNIFYHPGAEDDFPGDSLAFIGENRSRPIPAVLEDCVVDSNLYFCEHSPNSTINYLELVQQRGADLNGVASDPLFEGFENKGFKLSDKSPALKIGISSIEFHKIGRINL